MKQQPGFLFQCGQNPGFSVIEASGYFWKMPLKWRFSKWARFIGSCTYVLQNGGNHGQETIREVA
jgi:hypothetical protein